MAIAVFDYGSWSVRFPALALTTTPALAALLFAEATLLLDNTDTSPVVDPAQRLVLLNLIVAHLATLTGLGATGAVGRVKSAQEGSVQVETDYGNAKGDQLYWIQTSYGAQYWQLTAPYRTMGYIPGPVPYLDVPGSPFPYYPFARA